MQTRLSRSKSYEQHQRWLAWLLLEARSHISDAHQIFQILGLVGNRWIKRIPTDMPTGIRDCFGRSCGDYRKARL